MSNDAQKIQDAMMAIHTLWGAPCLIVVILVLLYQQVGWATFVGLGVMVVYAPVSGERGRPRPASAKSPSSHPIPPIHVCPCLHRRCCSDMAAVGSLATSRPSPMPCGPLGSSPAAKVAGKLMQIRKRILVWTDQRVSLMSEVINGIQVRAHRTGCIAAHSSRLNPKLGQSGDGQEMGVSDRSCEPLRRLWPSVPTTNAAEPFPCPASPFPRTRAHAHPRWRICPPLCR